MVDSAADQLAKNNLTDTLDKVPPHGMKGVLSGDQGWMTVNGILWLTFLVLLLGLALTGIFLAIGWWRRRRALKKQLRQAVIPKTKWEQLFADLDDIKVPTTSYDVDWNHFSSQLSLCLRRAIEFKTNWPMAESTTDEIVQRLKQESLHLAVFTDDDLCATLFELDRIRFGGQRLTTSESDQILLRVRTWCHSIESGGLRVFD